MSDVEQLYQELIIDHYKNPRCYGELSTSSATSKLLNPLCGDEINLSLLVKDGRVSEIAFSGKGCSISQASASMMGELCQGLTLQEAADNFGLFTKMMKLGLQESELDKLGDAASLQGVKKFAARIKCATLGWEALHKCISECKG